MRLLKITLSSACSAEPVSFDRKKAESSGPESGKSGANNRVASWISSVPNLETRDGVNAAGRIEELKGVEALAPDQNIVVLATFQAVTSCPPDKIVGGFRQAA